MTRIVNRFRVARSRLSRSRQSPGGGSTRDHTVPPPPSESESDVSSDQATGEALPAVDDPPAAGPAELEAGDSPVDEWPDGFDSTEARVHAADDEAATEVDAEHEVWPHDGVVDAHDGPVDVHDDLTDVFDDGEDPPTMVDEAPPGDTPEVLASGFGEPLPQPPTEEEETPATGLDDVDDRSAAAFPSPAIDTFEIVEPLAPESALSPGADGDGACDANADPEIESEVADDEVRPPSGAAEETSRIGNEDPSMPDPDEASPTPEPDVGSAAEPEAMPLAEVGAEAQPVDPDPDPSPAAAVGVERVQVADPDPGPDPDPHLDSEPRPHPDPHLDSGPRPDPDPLLRPEVGLEPQDEPEGESVTEVNTDEPETVPETGPEAERGYETDGIRTAGDDGEADTRAVTEAEPSDEDRAPTQAESAPGQVPIIHLPPVIDLTDSDPDRADRSEGRLDGFEDPGAADELIVDLNRIDDEASALPSEDESGTGVGAEPEIGREAAVEGDVETEVGDDLEIGRGAAVESDVEIKVQGDREIEGDDAHDPDEDQGLPTMEQLRAVSADLDEIDAALERLDDEGLDALIDGDPQVELATSTSTSTSTSTGGGNSADDTAGKHDG